MTQRVNFLAIVSDVSPSTKIFTRLHCTNLSVILQTCARHILVLLQCVFDASVATLTKLVADPSLPQNMPLVLFFKSAHTVGEWAVVYLPIKSDTNPSEAWYAIPTASSSCLAIIFTCFSMLLTQFLNFLVSPVN